MARTISNFRDAGRKFPVAALAPKVSNSDNNSVVEKITGPGASATVKLSKPAAAVVSIQAYVTSTGVAAAVEFPRLTTDYTVALVDATGLCALTDTSTSSHVTETWVVTYRPLLADGTVSGLGVVPDPAKKGQITP